MSDERLASADLRDIQEEWLARLIVSGLLSVLQSVERNWCHIMLFFSEETYELYEVRVNGPEAGDVILNLKTCKQRISKHLLELLWNLLDDQSPQLLSAQDRNLVQHAFSVSRREEQLAHEHFAFQNKEAPQGLRGITLIHRRHRVRLLPGRTLLLYADGARVYVTWTRARITEGRCFTNLPEFRYLLAEQIQQELWEGSDDPRAVIGVVYFPVLPGTLFDSGFAHAKQFMDFALTEET